MNQEKLKESGQFEYLGRWVDKKHFRAFVYNELESKLASSYEEYNRLVSSGLWFSTKQEAILVKENQEIAENLQNKPEKSENLEIKVEDSQKNDKKPSKSNKQR